ITVGMVLFDEPCRFVATLLRVGFGIWLAGPGLLYSISSRTITILQCIPRHANRVVGRNHDGVIKAHIRN
ncbi:MAG TPA: hypothetical protein VGO47_02715, partial [Chlamydiales bacterium]|nr:hypothetical protein [Chlamydiales bacterium]